MGPLASKGADSTERKLGTFLGVFTPTLLTILGVIMYMRTGWLVGHMGLLRALLIVLCANLITIITTFSFSSVATNGQIGVGGAYYIISRSLGLSIGGSVGFPLFFAQVFSVTLYSFGLAESLRIVWPTLPMQPVALGIIVGVGVLSMFGAQLALRTQIPLMALIGISIGAFAVGAGLKAHGHHIPLELPSGEVSFWMGFAVFFPAVTGIMAGLSLSGDLRDPQHAIPRGSLGAVGLGALVYLCVPILLAISAAPEDLRNDPMIWLKIAPFGALLILPALWGAIFSSAVGSMLSAPRTLQALARDGLLPRFLGRRGLAAGFTVTIGIALAAVFLGDLNKVAPVVTMFFLTVYGMLNIVAAIETLSGDPSWRPAIRLPWFVNLLGGLACIAVMLLINAWAGLLALLAELLLWLFLSRREQAVTWGDARRGIYESLVRWGLLRMARRPIRARNWRPHVLIFVPDPERHLDLIRFGNWFSQGRGVVSVVQLVVGDLLHLEEDLEARRAEMKALFEREQIVVFPEVNVVEDELHGITHVAQGYGLAGFGGNTVVLGWPRRRERLVQFLRVMRRLECMGKSLVIGRIRPRFLYPREGIVRMIHVWWGGLHQNGDLMLLLAYLLTRNDDWRDSEVQVMSIASNDLTKAETESYLRKLIDSIRIEADIRVIVRSKDQSVREIIHRESAAAEVVFFGLATPETGGAADYADRLEDLAGELPTVFFVKNASCFIGELMKAEVETGHAPGGEEHSRPEE